MANGARLRSRVQPIPQPTARRTAPPWVGDAQDIKTGVIRRSHPQTEGPVSLPRRPGEARLQATEGEFDPFFMRGIFDPGEGMGGLIDPKTVYPYMMAGGALYPPAGMALWGGLGTAKMLEAADRRFRQGENLHPESEGLPWGQEFGHGAMEAVGGPLIAKGIGMAGRAAKPYADALGQRIKGMFKGKGPAQTPQADGITRRDFNTKLAAAIAGTTAAVKGGTEIAKRTVGKAAEQVARPVSKYFLSNNKQAPQALISRLDDLQHLLAATGKPVANVIHEIRTSPGYVASYAKELSTTSQRVLSNTASGGVFPEIGLDHVRWLAMKEYEILLRQLTRASRQAVLKGHGWKKSPLGPHLSNRRVPYPEYPKGSPLEGTWGSPRVIDDFLKEAAKKFGYKTPPSRARHMQNRFHWGLGRG